MSKRLRSAPLSTSDEDQNKSASDWNGMKVEVLKLKCLEYNLLSSGKKADIVRRLVEHFKKNNNINNTGNNTNMSISIPTSAVATSVDFNPPASSSQSSPPNMTDFMSEVRAMREEYRSEVSALRSELSAIKKRAVSFNIEGDNSTNSSSTHSPLPSSQPYNVHPMNPILVDTDATTTTTIPMFGFNGFSTGGNSHINSVISPMNVSNPESVCENFSTMATSNSVL